MTFRKVAENIYVIDRQPAYANVTALVFPGRVIMVDCGIQLPAVMETRKEIEKISKRKLEVVVLTHFHSDHTKAISAFSDCRVISSNRLLRNLKQANRKTSEEAKLTLPNEAFDDQLEIQDGDVRLVIKRTGGHTDGSTYAYCPNYKVIVAGDNFWVNYYPWGGARNGDPDEWIQALKEYLSLDAKYFIPGHGPVAGKDKIVELLDYINNVREVMKEMILSGKTEEEVLKAGWEVEYYTSGNAKPSTLKKWCKIWSHRHAPIMNG
ncbi:MAG: MBL fold metallo-hydrolase [Candidatus Bathyarchaeota archaeon]|nr:MAG: MBL fold metallo-hydrolase [Candidatus Bathyarchaeota archaeon]